MQQPKYKQILSLADYNNSRLLSMDIVTGKQYRRIRRGTNKNNK